MNRFYHAVAIASLSLLAGACAAPGNGQASAAQEPSAAAMSPATEAAVSAPPVQNTESEVSRLEKPVTVAFDKSSVDLGEEHRELVARIAAESGNATQIVLIGMCDRSAIDNAREVAIARAVSMRDALRKAGSTVKNVRIKYRTAQPSHGVIVSWGD